MDVEVMGADIKTECWSRPGFPDSLLVPYLGMQHPMSQQVEGGAGHGGGDGWPPPGLS